MNDVTGRPGELIDRLIDLLNCDALGETEWYSVSLFAVHAIGGTALCKVTPDTGKAPAPGTVGEWMSRHYEVVSRERYFDLIHDRLSELVMEGVEEAFLVRSTRDEVRRVVGSLTDVGKGDQNRAETREYIERIIQDPTELAGFRAQLMASGDPDASLTDEEIAAKLHRMKESEVLQPTSAESATELWALLDHWDEQAASLLSDTLFEQWRSEHARRGRR